MRAKTAAIVGIALGVLLLLAALQHERTRRSVYSWRMEIYKQCKKENNADLVDAKTSYETGDFSGFRERRQECRDTAFSGIWKPIVGEYLPSRWN